MAILNYTTTVDPNKTVMQIQNILGARGAKKILIEYENGQVSSIKFSVMVHEQEVHYRLPSNAAGVLRAMQKQKVPFRYRNNEHARRVSWRILKDWVEAQMALIEAGQAEIGEVFLPYALHPSGVTLFEYLSNNGRLLTQG